MELDFTFDTTEELEKAITEYIEDNMSGSEFMICSEASREEKVTEYIKDSLWAFNAEFILEHTKGYANYYPGQFERLKKSLRKMQEELCEDANELILAMIEDIDDFISDAISADGYAHFLNTYDGNEEEYYDEDEGEYYYIYRTN